MQLHNKLKLKFKGDINSLKISRKLNIGFRHKCFNYNKELYITYMSCTYLIILILSQTI